jgi:hypothetical protein
LPDALILSSIAVGIGRSPAGMVAKWSFATVFLFMASRGLKANVARS